MVHWVFVLDFPFLVTLFTKHFLKECIIKTVYFQGLVLSGIEFMEIFVEKKKNSKITKVEPIKSGNNNY